MIPIIPSVSVHLPDQMVIQGGPEKRKGAFLVPVLAHLHTPYGSMGNLSRRKMSQRSPDSVEWFSFYADYQSVLIFLQLSRGSINSSRVSFGRLSIYYPEFVGEKLA